MIQTTTLVPSFLHGSECRASKSICTRTGTRSSTQFCLLNSDTITMLVASTIKLAIVLTISEIITPDVTARVGHKSAFILKQVANKLFAVGAELL